MYSTSIVLLFVLGAAIAHPPAIAKDYSLSSRIHGGKDTPIESRPYQVSLHTWTDKFFCGGSIVDAEHVVTAAHCITPNLTYVRAGSSYTDREGSIHNVTKTFRHKKFIINKYKNAHYDVAVIRVDPPFKFDEKRQPIAMFQTNEKSAPGIDAVVSGWGRMENKTLSDHLKSVTIRIVNKKSCDLAYQPVGGLGEGEICAGDYGIGAKSPCSGDSGGPLTINGQLAGIVSYSEGCGERFYPAVFAEVAYFYDWLQEQLSIVD